MHTSEKWAAPTPGNHVIRLREKLFCGVRTETSLTIVHLHSKLNVEADKVSREFHDDTEWSLGVRVYRTQTSRWRKSDVDPFASRLNAKLTCYVAWKPDPNANAIDAFTLNWSVFTRILFFPFQCYHKSTSEYNPVTDNCHTSSSRLANTVLVPSSDINAPCSSCTNKSSEYYIDSAAQCLQSSLVLPQPPVDWFYPNLLSDLKV